MKCMVFVKATKDSEKGTLPTAELMAAMGKFNHELIEAGIMKGGGGLKPTSQAKRMAQEMPEPNAGRFRH